MATVLLFALLGLVINSHAFLHIPISRSAVVRRHESTLKGRFPSQIISCIPNAAAPDEGDKQKHLPPLFNQLNISGVSSSFDAVAAESGWKQSSWEEALHWNFIGTYFGPLLAKFVRDEDILNIATKALSGILWGAILLGMLGSIGFDTKPLLSLFGVAGITLGLSLKDVFSDIYSGVFVLFTRPFKRGSVVTIAGFTGKVVSMDMRYIRIYSSAEKSDILVPVSMVYRNAIKVAVDDPKNRK